MSQLGDAIFTETQQQVLGLLYGSPGKTFYLKEILRLTGMGVATIKRELDRMLAAGILQRSKVGNQHHYQANPACPVYRELLALVRKTCFQSPNREETGEQPHAAAHSVAHSMDSSLAYPTETFPSQAAYVHETQPGGDSVLVSTSDLELITRRYHIRRLSLFGSAARGALGADSDIDLLVEFQPGQAPTLGGMASLREALSGLFGGRRVDLATPAILRNPYRRRTIEKDLRLLYAAR